jgi:transposase-like protein
MDQIKRIKRSEATWREIFARHVTSGMSVLEFCRAEGINPGVFRRWRSMLNGDDMKGKKTQAHARAAAKAVTSFIDIGAVGAGQSRMEVRLELGGGVVLTVARG